MKTALIGGPADGGAMRHGNILPRQWALVVGEMVVATADESERLVGAFKDAPRRYLYQLDRDRGAYVYVGALTKAGAA